MNEKDFNLDAISSVLSLEEVRKIVSVFSFYEKITDIWKQLSSVPTRR